MDARYHSVCLIGAVGLLLLVGPGCSKKSVQAGADAAALAPGKGKAGDRTGSSEMASPDTASSAPGETGESSAPTTGAPEQDLAAQGRAASETSPTGGAPSETSLARSPAEPGPLQGLEPIRAGKTPSEERVEGGMMVAKADAGEAARRRSEEMERDRLAAAMAGLKDVFFTFDRWDITENGKGALAEDADWLKSNPGTRVVIEGHCDERGTLAYNMVLGEKRANAARNYLVELGVKPGQLTSVSYGKERPSCKEHNEACYQRNRRAHVAPRVE